MHYYRAVIGILILVLFGLQCSNSSSVSKKDPASIDITGTWKLTKIHERDCITIWDVILEYAYDTTRFPTADLFCAVGESEYNMFWQEKGQSCLSSHNYAIKIDTLHRENPGRDIFYGTGDDVKWYTYAIIDQNHLTIQYVLKEDIIQSHTKKQRTFTLTNYYTRYTGSVPPEDWNSTIQPREVDYPVFTQ